MTKQFEKVKPEFHKKDINTESSLTASDLMSIMQESSDVKERLLKETSDKLFDPKLLNYICDIDNNMAFYLIKHFIIRSFYTRPYSKLSYTITIVKIDKPPFYDKIIKYNDIEYLKLCDTAYDTFLVELREITVSFKRQGRKELVSLFESLNERVRHEEMKQGFLKNFGLGG